MPGPPTAAATRSRTRPREVATSKAVQTPLDEKLRPPGAADAAQIPFRLPLEKLLEDPGRRFMRCSAEAVIRALCSRTRATTLVHGDGVSRGGEAQLEVEVTAPRQALFEALDRVIKAPLDDQGGDAARSPFDQQSIAGYGRFRGGRRGARWNWRSFRRHAHNSHSPRADPPRSAAT